MPWLSCAPPAALTLVRPRPPCISTYGLGRGADLASGGRFLAHRVAFYRSSRRCDMPPAPSALPPGVGRSRGLLGVCVLRQGASRFAMSFMRSPNANLDAQILAKKPTKPGGQRRRRGGLVLAFCTTDITRGPPDRTTDAKSAPLLRRSRNTGGPRTTDREGRGGRGGRTKKN